ncbi:solute:sodium symporter family transporter [Agathobaculum sp. NTUH-O15-33]|uniref:solute:sodium symporter family transporter n=1 Tax=Agathobaculum sp. NTUH-O15-33 TaxID=3079302 RepID=UPI0029587EF4|nr:solute:sodium symporter family transporter [Agathobaculum sp. NTUH-O15-33]WNX85877.1 solute:sodium symporter family transporter [Agathobaculum sp. NTUH-O15-33]
MFALITFVGFTALVALISWLKTRGDNVSTKEGYFLAGRGLSGVVICGSLMMTNLSAEQLVGRNGQGYAAGMTAMGWEAICPIALTLMALFFLPRYLKLGVTTIPEFLETRYDRKTRVLVSFIFLVAYIVTMLPLVLYSGSVVMEQIFGVSELLGTDRFVGITLMCVALGVIGGIYAIFGGLKAVAVSDSLNGVIFIAGAALLVPILAFVALGDGSLIEGVRAFAFHTPKGHLNSISPVDALPPYIPWPMMLIGCTINHVSYYCTNQSIMQRVLGAKSLAEAQKGSLLSGILLVFCPLFLVVPGIIAFVMSGGGLPSFDQAYPWLLLQILPKPLVGFFAAVMFGAILSSFNSVLNSSMTMFTLDVLPVFSGKKRDDLQLIRLAKRFGIILCLLSIAIAPFLMYLPAGISTFLNQMWGYYGVPVLAVAVMGMLNRRVPNIAPKVTIAVHIVCYGLMMRLLPNVHFLYFETASFVIDIVLLALFAKFYPRPAAYELRTDQSAIDMTPWKYRYPVIAVTFAVMAGMYALFSPIGLAR